MSQSLRKSSEKSGMQPGALIHIGTISDDETRMWVFDYSKAGMTEHQVQSVDEIVRHKDSATVTWLIVEGLADVTVIERIGEAFGIHHLVLEDILNTDQRPKFEEYDDYLYIVFKCLLPKEDEQFAVSEEQISLLVLDKFVIAFKEKCDDLFEPIQQRIRANKGRLRELGSDYLAYSILDTVVDQNFVLIDALDEAITSLETRLLISDPTQDLLIGIQNLKRELVTIRRQVSPMRELMAQMLRCDSGLIDEKTHLYLRDVADHVVRVVEAIDAFREILTGLLEIYISSVSNKMNEIMKVLTIFASIFIPLSFVAGIYGMNFKYMPELEWHWAYPTLWIAFVTIPVALLIYFKKKNWF